MAAMDWLKLFALLVAVASVGVTADGPKKKIRIHLPQPVKHIHHHKKIYITNYPAPSQYAPAYMPGAKGAVALPTSVARPAVARLVPLSSVNLFEEPHHRLPGVSPAASKLLPLYRARGHYGPNHSEWNEQEYDLLPPPDPTDVYPQSSYAYSPEASVHSHSVPPKKVKIVKVNSVPRKKVVRKVKPKRVYVRQRPPPSHMPAPVVEDEHPVSSYHEQFYSDIDDAGTIRKIKKPPRIEKIIDGDTEHIHTYSEEHIHKVVFDDDSKLTGVVGVDHLGSMSAFAASHPLVPLKNAQTLLAVVGSMGTPSHMEYSSYNPRDVTHDHIYHDHGELPRGVEVSKDILRLPPKVSYNSRGVRITGDASKRRPGKQPLRYGKPTSTSSDFSYYENIYAPKLKKAPKITYPKYYEGSPETTINDFRPIPAFNFKDKRKTKQRNNVQSYGSKQVVPNFQLQQASVPAPFAVTSTVVHDYNYNNNNNNYNNNNYNNNKHYANGPSSSSPYSKYKDTINDFKDSYSNDFDYDTYASSSNLHTTEDKNESLQDQSGKKSVSSQNINFGGTGHQSFVDHFESSASNAELSISDDVPTALGQDDDNFDQATNTMTPTPFSIKETSSAHPYYTAMVFKAVDSNDDADYAESPTESTDTETSIITTTSHPTPYHRIQNTNAITPDSEFTSETRTKKRREKQTSHRIDHRQRYNEALKDLLQDYHSSERAQGKQGTRHENDHTQPTESTNVRGNPKYGDKI